jgi:hypothetical protein
MKRTLAWLGAIALGLFVTYQVCDAAVQASVERYTNGTTEIYNLDGSGNQRLAGWQAVSGSQTVTGAMGVTGALSVTGATSLTGTATHTGKTVYAPTIFGGGSVGSFGILGSSVIPYTATNMVILATASTVMVSLPTISTNVIAGLSGVGGTGGVIDDGSYLVLTTTSTTGVVYRVKDNSTLSGTLLDLSGAVPTTEMISSTRPATFQFNAGTGHWVQTSPFNGF